jgi:hypothetical protein
LKANWRDNPWFPTVLEEERQFDLSRYPDRYSHVWEGDYAKAFEGAYFARELAVARQQGRIGHAVAKRYLEADGRVVIADGSFALCRGGHLRVPPSTAFTTRRMLRGLTRAKSANQLPPAAAGYSNSVGAALVSGEKVTSQLKGT